jgi:WD40 repeat protein
LVDDIINYIHEIGETSQKTHMDMIFAKIKKYTNAIMPADTITVVKFIEAAIVITRHYYYAKIATQDILLANMIVEETANRVNTVTTTCHNELIAKIDAQRSFDDQKHQEVMNALANINTTNTLSDYRPDRQFSQYYNERKSSSNAEAEYAKKIIWEASKREYLASRSEGSRFSNLNILSGLLPHGYIIHTDFVEYGKTKNGDIKPLLEILNEHTADNIAVIGEGGIGKTTFLLKTMEEAYSVAFEDKAVVPVFIELNRCPAQIGAWYSASSNKTNFITRYIALQISSCELEDSAADVLAFIENEFKKENKRQRAEYIILLDGFNEVNRGGAVGKDGSPIGSSIREMLNKEIKALMTYPNIRVITTSRKTDLAFFPGMTVNVELTGVRKTDIEAHLHENKYSQWDINQIMASRKLMDCLRIPLFLCMFTATGLKDGQTGHGTYRPITRGEILYCFFNRSQGIYNERLNAERLNPTSTFDKKQTFFILDFVLPYIGWTMEYTDFFNIEREDILKIIDDFFNSDDDEITFWNKNATVFRDYESEIVSLSDFKDAIMAKGFNAVLDCIINTLGAMYRDKYYDYSFVHHHVRDYFAGIYEIQRIRMAEAFHGRFLKDKNRQRIGSAFDALSLVNANIWSETKRVFIGEILCEHRNTPEPDENGKWAFPPIVCPEQNTLRNVLDVFRYAERPVYCGVLNVVETMKAVRSNLAGENFSGLSIVECRLHGVNCSLGRGDNILAANFQDTKISDDVFETEGHTDDIQYFAYSKHADYLFAMSDDNIVKRWETDTGHCVNTIKIECGDMVESDQLTQSHFAPANDGESFLTTGFTPLKDRSGHLCFVQQYDWKNRRVVYESAGDFHDINTMSYSVDDKYIAVVYAHNNLRIYERDNTAPVFCGKLDNVGNVIEALILETGQVLLFYTCGNDWWHEKEETVVGGEEEEEEDEDIEEIIYRMSLFDTKTNLLDVLHEYTAEVDIGEEDAVAEAFSPLYAVDSKGETVMFFEDEALKKLDIKSRTMIDMPFNYGEPDYITFAPNTEVLFVLFYDECIRYDVAQGCEIGLYQYDGLNYQIAGKHSALRLLMFDDELDSYERNLVTDSLTPKYQKSKRSIVDVFISADSAELIVTFDNDSLWVIDEQSSKLLETICYSEPDAKSCLSLYSAVSDRMVFLFESDNYEYIKCYNLKTGKSERSYFDFVDKHKIKEMFMPESEDCLFCVFEKSVEEINLNTLKLTEVFKVDESEFIQAAHYCEADNHVRIITSFITDAGSLANKPRAYEVKKNIAGKYQHVSWYELPYLEKKFLRYMSAFHREVFTQPQTTGDKFKLNHEFFISSGVFLDYVEEYDDDIAAVMRVDKHIINGDGIDSIVNTALNPLEVNYVIGDLPVILTRMNYEGNDLERELPIAYEILDVSDDKQTIVSILTDGLIVFQFYDGFYNEVCRFSSSFENPLNALDGEGSGVSGARIGKDGFVYYWVGANSLHRLDTRDGENKTYERYTPGLSVMGCDFTDADMSTVTRFTLVMHGGNA